VHFANQLALSPHAQVISGAMDVNALSYTLDDSATAVLPLLCPGKARKLLHWACRISQKFVL
jgi:hypothetical protein